MTPEDPRDRQAPREPEPGEEPDELSPEDEAAVRRLLAAASAGPVTMPDDVAARLDDVLAGLRHERDQEPRTPAATQLSDRRRRRWPQALLAAAAVAVVTAGIGSIVTDQRGGEGDSAGTADAPVSAERAPSSGAEEDRAREPESEAAPDARENPQALSDALVPTTDLPRVRPATLTADAQRVLDLGIGVVPASERSAVQPTGSCALPRVADGEQLAAVRLDGRRATLVFGPEDQGSREAAVYSCDDSAAPVLTTTVQAR